MAGCLSLWRTARRAAVRTTDFDRVVIWKPFCFWIHRIVPSLETNTSRGGKSPGFSSEITSSTVLGARLTVTDSRFNRPTGFRH